MMTWHEIATLLQRLFDESWQAFRAAHPAYDAGVKQRRDILAQQEIEADAACQVIAVDLCIPPNLHPDVWFSCIERLRQAKLLAEFVTHTATVVPMNHTARRVHVPDFLTWLLIDYWHHVGLYRSMYESIALQYPAG